MRCHTSIAANEHLPRCAIENVRAEGWRGGCVLLSSCVKSQRRIMNIFIELSGQRVAFLQDQESKLLFRQPERR